MVIGLLALPGHSVRLKPPQALDTSRVGRHLDDVLERGRSADNGAACSQNVPKIGKFRRWWSDMWEREQPNMTFYNKASQRMRAAAPIRMVLGVFTRAGCDDRKYRQAIRDTWFQQPGVCVLGDFSPAPRCSVHVTFVVGNNGQETGEEDLTILPIKENMDLGKTHAWFHHASREFTWATHIAKIDMDAFPHIAKMLHGMHTQLAESKPKCSNVVGGRLWRCWDEPFCPPYSCGQAGEDFLRHNIDDPRCFSYMQGAFYFVSRELAVNTSVPGGFWETESAKCYPEDVIAGHAIQQFASQHQVCVSTVRFETDEAYWHKNVWRPWDNTTGCPEKL